MQNTNTRPKVGLALSGGAAKGLAHIGVLEVLEREGIPIDYISGTSIGAIVGAFYAYTKNLDLMKDLAKEAGSKRAHFFSDIIIQRAGLIKFGHIERLLRKSLADANFSDLRIPFRCIAVDMDSGDEVVLSYGPLWQAIRASASMPLIISPTMIGGRNLLDGGLLNPLPVSAAKEMGADYVIAVNLMQSPGEAPVAKPSFLSIMMKTIHIIGSQSLFEATQMADAVIAPDLSNIGFTDFHCSDECIELGRLAAANAMPLIKSQLSELHVI